MVGIGYNQLFETSLEIGWWWVRLVFNMNKELVSLPPPDAEKMMAIFEKSAKEQAAGYLGPWVSKSRMDAKYGVNGWRAMKRFARQRPAPRDQQEHPPEPDCGGRCSIVPMLMR